MGALFGGAISAKLAKANALYGLISVAVGTVILVALQLMAFDGVLVQIAYFAALVGMAYALGMRRWQLLSSVPLRAPSL